MRPTVNLQKPPESAFQVLLDARSQVRGPSRPPAHQQQPQSQPQPQLQQQQQSHVPGPPSTYQQAPAAPQYPFLQSQPYQQQQQQQRPFDYFGTLNPPNPAPIAPATFGRPSDPFSGYLPPPPPSFPSQTQAPASRGYGYPLQSRRHRHDHGYYPSDSDTDVSDTTSFTSVSSRRSRRSRTHRKKKSTLSPAEERIILDQIKKHLPADNQDLFFQDIKLRLNEARQNGDLDNYDPDKHTADENETMLYSVKLKREAETAKRRVTGMLDFGAFMATSFGKAMGIEWIKTNRVHKYMQEAIEGGEFDDSLEGIGPSLRGTVFESPVFGTALKVIEIISKAHEDELRDEADKQDDEFRKLESRRDKRMDQIRNIQERGQALVNSSKTGGAKPSPATNGLPRPDVFRAPTESKEEKKMH
jgi:hypothetical protein